MELNRKERRALEHGKGRNSPMIEIVDIESAYDYSMSMPVYLGLAPFERLFINWQVDYDWVEDDWDQLS